MKNRLLSVLSVFFVAMAPNFVQAQFAGITNADGSFSITNYSGPGGAVVIPSTLNGLVVSGIGSQVFEGNTNLTSLIMPNSVTNLGSSVLEFCTALTNVVLSTNLASIAPADFEFCTHLSSLALPPSITAIGSEGFEYCTGLTNIVIPTNVNTIDDAAFYFCTFLTGVVIPSSVTNLASAAFYFCTNLSSVELSPAMGSIASGTFTWCASLTNVYIPASVTNLSYSAFAACSNLTGLFFQGNAPASDPTSLTNDDNVTIYYLPGKTGWSNTFDSAPALLWNPAIQTNANSPSLNSGQLTFTITGTPNIPIIIEACTNLAQPIWSPATSLITLAGGSYTFTDPLAASAPARFYRLRSP